MVTVKQPEPTIRLSNFDGGIDREILCCVRHVKSPSDTPCCNLERVVLLFVERAGVSGSIINVALLGGRNRAMNPNATLC